MSESIHQPGGLTRVFEVKVWGTNKVVHKIQQGRRGEDWNRRTSCRVEVRGKGDEKRAKFP